MFLILLIASDKVEDRRQDKDCRTLGQSSNDTKDQSQVVDEYSSHSDYDQVGKADE